MQRRIAVGRPRVAWPISSVTLECLHSLQFILICWGFFIYLFFIIIPLKSIILPALGKDSLSPCTELNKSKVSFKQLSNMIFIFRKSTGLQS